MFAEDVIFCQPSWILESTNVRMAVTKLGGHMGPVQFCKESEGGSIQPYFVSPWQCEENNVPVGRSEKVLRGDFFCLPFGYGGEEMDCPSHGKTAGGQWSLDGYKASHGVHELRIVMENALGPAKVTRQYFLRDGEGVVYDRTTVIGLSGAHTVGHHAVLRVPSMPSSLLISASPQRFGMTYPIVAEGSEGVTMQSVAAGAEFMSLDCVPLAPDGSKMVDLSSLPLARSSTDLLQFAVLADAGQPGWTAAVNTEEGYLWFSLRDVAVLPLTLMWIENRGRQEAPWNGRSCVLGLEDVCSFFDMGSKVSHAENAFSKRGIKTVHQFESDRPLVVSYIQGATSVPREFGRVHTVEFLEGFVHFTDARGTTVRVELDSNFLFGKDLFDLD